MHKNIDFDLLWSYNQRMNIIVTGASSGIGRLLSRELINQNHQVWGIARRKELLKNLAEEINDQHFYYSVGDVSEKDFWELLIKKIKEKKFRPDVVVFNAAISENDLSKTIDTNLLSYIMEVNFFSIMRGIKIMIGQYRRKVHFVTISSTSALKGTGSEGIGYAASKAALSIAFESLYQKFINTDIFFSTVYLGPVRTTMMRFRKPPPLLMSQKQAVDGIIKSINERKPFYFLPKVIFILLRILLLLPRELTSRLIVKLQKSYIT